MRSATGRCKDPLVVDALEEWASREAASIMVGLFVVAAGVMVAGGARRRSSWAAVAAGGCRIVEAPSSVRVS